MNNNNQFIKNLNTFLIFTILTILISLNIMINSNHLQIRENMKEQDIQIINSSEFIQISQNNTQNIIYEVLMIQNKTNELITMNE